MSDISYWGQIAIIYGSIITACTIIYKSLKYLYCKGKNDQNSIDDIKDLRTRLEYVENELGNLQIDISKYRIEEAKKLDDIKNNQAEIKTDMAVIKTILKKNFPS